MTKECLESYTDEENRTERFCHQIRASQVSRLLAKSHILDNDSSLRPVRGKSSRETARGECRDVTGISAMLRYEIARVSCGAN